jgi:hypothetical protein
LLKKPGFGQGLDQSLHVAGRKLETSRDVTNAERLCIVRQEVQDIDSAADRLVFSATHNSRRHDMLSAENSNGR